MKVSIMAKFIRALLIGSGALLVFLETACLLMLYIILTENGANNEIDEEISLFQQPGVHIGLLITGLVLFRIGARIDEWFSPVCRSNPDTSVCWFCNKRPPDPKSICEVKMNRKITEQDKLVLPIALLSSIQYQKKNIEIPRCEICKNMHECEKIGMVLFVVSFFGILSGMASVCACYLTLKTWIEVAITIVVFCVFMVLGGIMIALPVKSSENHPKIESLKAQDWKIGEKPKD